MAASGEAEAGVYVALAAPDGLEPGDARTVARFKGAMVVHCTTSRALSLCRDAAALGRPAWICASLGGAESYARCVDMMAAPRLRV